LEGEWLILSVSARPLFDAGIQSIPGNFTPWLRLSRQSGGEAMAGAVVALAMAACRRAQQRGVGPLILQASTVRFDRPLFTTEGAALCPRQHQIAALRRALDANDRAAFDRAAKDGACKMVGPDIRLTVVARPGAYDPDVEVRVSGEAPAGIDPGTLPRGTVWTLKSMVRN
jgi:hypothetical protein